jgi:6,7-dimethyl-8-ribityllumazine synthase
MLAHTHAYHAIVALGAVIRGETPHFDFVAAEAARGLQQVALETGVPIAFGVLTTDTMEQAEARVGKGGDAAMTAIEMARFGNAIGKAARS